MVVYRRMQTTFTSRRPQGFTLIELIVVIAILATLASIAYPGYMAFMDEAKRTSASKTCTDIVEAVTRFKTDNNGALPYNPGAVKADRNDQISLVTADGKDADLLKILTNRETDEDNRINSLKEFYLKSTEVEEKSDGLYVDPGTGDLGLYDPWGKPYYVILCEEQEGCMDPFTRKRLRGKSCIVYGLGPDGEGVAPSMTTRKSSASGSRKGGKKDKDGKKGKKDKEAAQAAAEEAAEAIEDNVYSWKKISK